MTRVRQNTQCVIGFNNDAAFGHFFRAIQSEEGTFVFMTSFLVMGIDGYAERVVYTIRGQFAFDCS